MVVSWAFCFIGAGRQRMWGGESVEVAFMWSLRCWKATDVGGECVKVAFTWNFEGRKATDIRKVIVWVARDVIE